MFRCKPGEFLPPPTNTPFSVRFPVLWHHSTPLYARPSTNTFDHTSSSSENMEQAISQKLSQLPAPKSRALAADPIDTGTRASAWNASHGGLHKPVQTLAKPFDHPTPVCGTATGGLATSLSQESTLFKPYPTDSQTKQSTQYAVDRPWTTRSPKQPSKDAHTYPFNPRQHSDPFRRWQAEPMAEGPYQMIGSVGTPQQSPSQSGKSNVKSILDAPSYVSATRGSSRAEGQ
jgi:hypothetical protein